MGLISMVLGLPLAPARGVIKLAEVIQERVNEEMHDPASARRELEAVSEARAAGEISEEEEAELQQQIVNRMVGPISVDNQER
jgi:uncharacterized membrane protein